MLLREKHLLSSIKKHEYNKTYKILIEIDLNTPLNQITHLQNIYQKDNNSNLQFLVYKFVIRWSMDDLNTNKFLTFNGQQIHINFLVDFYCCEKEICKAQFDYFSRCLKQAYPRSIIKNNHIESDDCQFIIIDQVRQVNHKFEIIANIYYSQLKVNDRTEISEFNVTLLIKKIKDFLELDDE
ncbi:hypothetical protein pb186bvf_018208 [Paramecium bursaria]